MPAPTPPPHAPPIWSANLLRVHLVLAHLCLLIAVAWTALHPAGLLGSVLHPEVLACVHLVTLGCIVTSCLGAFHVAMPMAMGTRLRADWRDWFLLVAVQLTATGVASHMALGTYSGVQWSALLLFVALGLQLGRFAAALRSAKAPFALRLGCVLAWANLLLAVLLGGTMALQRTHPGLPLDPLQSVFAHAHLALGGFAGTLVAAVGMRLLPMFLPALPPPRGVALGAVIGLGGGGALCGIGALLPGWLDAGLWILFGGACCWVAGVAAMLVRRRPPPPAGLPRVLPAHLLTIAAIAAFLVAVATGGLLHLHWLDATWWPVYGGVLIVGGFGSLVLGIGQRLLPLAVRLHSGRSDAHRLPSPHLGWFSAATWVTGLAMFPVALRTGSEWVLRIALALLAAAVVADGWNLLRKG
ncbi:MAG TPA: hypothetical protein VFT55_03640 [Planctomycetota bacterium]|nr:hypothetical protein [Planctomycetota bacterium]